MIRLLLLTAALALTALAADVTGTWKGTADTAMGPVVRTFEFKVDGDKLTGETTSSLSGKSTIVDGKVDGDKISFNITISVQGNELKLQYTGVVSGNEIKFHVETADGGVALDYTVKKVS